MQNIPVAMRSGVTPVPIPNTTVKTRAAESTMLETAWEDRWLPDLKKSTFTISDIHYVSEVCQTFGLPSRAASLLILDLIYSFLRASSRICTLNQVHLQSVPGLIAQPVRAHA